MDEASILMHLLARYAGGCAEIYIKGDDKPWQVMAIDELYEDVDFTFVGARLEADGRRIVVNLATVSSIVFGAEGEDPDGGEEITGGGENPPNVIKMRAV